jgi:cell division ATPase FtsA
MKRREVITLLGGAALLAGLNELLQKIFRAKNSVRLKGRSTLLWQWSPASLFLVTGRPRKMKVRECHWHV